MLMGNPGGLVLDRLRCLLGPEGIHCAQMLLMFIETPRYNALIELLAHHAGSKRKGCE